MDSSLSEDDKLESELNNKEKDELIEKRKDAIEEELNKLNDLKLNEETQPSGSTSVENEIEVSSEEVDLKDEENKVEDKPTPRPPEETDNREKVNLMDRGGNREIDN